MIFRPLHFQRCLLSRLSVALLTLGALFAATVSKTEAEYAFTLIADSTGPVSEFGYFPSLNSTGTVAFRAWLDNGSAGVFSGNGGLITAIATSALPFVGFGDPAINDAGTVEFFESTGGNNSIDGIYAGNGGPLTTIASTAGQFNYVAADTSINAAGTVAFSGSLKSGGRVFLRGTAGWRLCSRSGLSAPLTTRERWRFKPT